MFRRLVVLGGSAAGMSAAVAAREAGFEGDLTVIDADPRPFYDRCLLSVEFLVDELSDAQLTMPEPSGLDIHWRRGSRAVSVDLADQSVRLADGDTLPFDRLVVATGSQARTAPAGSGRSSRVLSLRTLDDAHTVRAALRRIDHDDVTIIGGGLIGTEIAASAARLGLTPTLLVRTHAPLERLLGIDASQRVLRHLRSLGVDVRTGTGLADVREIGSDVGLGLTSGATLTAGLVVVATGAKPNVEYLRESGLSVRDGVMCDATLHAVGAETVAAAGDIARLPHPLLGGSPTRVEHWSSARETGRLAGANLTRGRWAAESFAGVPDFGVSLQGESLRIVGFPQAATEVRPLWGSLHGARCGLAYVRHGRLVGVVSFHDSAAARRFTPHIGRRLTSLT